MDPTCRTEATAIRKGQPGYQCSGTSLSEDTKGDWNQHNLKDYLFTWWWLSLLCFIFSKMTGTKIFSLSSLVDVNYTITERNKTNDLSITSTCLMITSSSACNPHNAIVPSGKATLKYHLCEHSILLQETASMITAIKMYLRWND